MTTTTTAQADLVDMEVGADVANAIVKAIAIKVTDIGERMAGAPIDTPGDLSQIKRDCDRIARLAAVNHELLWRTHHGLYQSAEERAALGLSIRAEERTLLDLAGVLRHCSDSWTDDEAETAAFANASRVVARAVGSIGDEA